ncbi:centromere protein R [Suncus etruscus]|uniref:centromere protein R n=1 Tax=Suncus etruscus TaxID=109475 RepID=UPI0021101C67|nr:centromere protein R [Suncus etruscus]
MTIMDSLSLGPAKNTRKESIAAYSPTTGTRQMSPFGSPTNSKGQDHPNEPSNEKCGKLNNLNLPESKKSTTDTDAEFMRLLSNVKRSSKEILDIMNDLSSIQALGGSRELENLIGFTRTPGLLQEELKKTEELMTKITKQKLFEKKISEVADQEMHHIDSYDFLKAILK